MTLKQLFGNVDTKWWIDCLKYSVLEQFFSKNE